MNTLLRIYPGDGWLILAANVLVQATVIILTAWLLARLGGRWNAARRHTTFFVALLCVLASPFLAWVAQVRGISILTLRASAPVPPVEISAVRPPNPRAVDAPTQRLAAQRAVDLKAENPEHVLPIENPIVGSFPDILRACGGLTVFVWLAGVAVQLARWCHGLYLIAGLRRAVSPLDCEPVAEVMCQVRQAVGTTRLPRMTTSVDLDRPIMVGLIRPLAILPEDALRTLHSRKLTDILIHECAHAVCRHHVVVLLQKVAAMLFWFHPLVHFMNRELARAREEICDNYVLRHSDAARYARTLLELSQGILHASSRRPALGLFHYRWTLEERVADLLDKRRMVLVQVNRWTAAALGAVFLFLGLLIAGTRIVQAEPVVEEQPAPQIPSSAPSLTATLSAEVRRSAKNPWAGNIFAVRFSPDGATLASSSGDGTIRLWDVASHENTALFVSPKVGEIPDEQILIKSLAYSPDGKTIAAAEFASAGFIRLWDVASGKNTAKFNGHAEPWLAGIEGIYCVVFSNDGQTLITGSESNVIRFWDAASGKVTATLKADSGDMIYALALSPDGTTLASGSKQGKIKLWDLASGTNTATFQAAGAGNGVFSVVFSPDGKTLGAGCWMNGGAMLWDVARGTNTAKFKPERADSATTNNPKDMTYSVAFSPDGSVFAQGCANGIIVLWDLKSRKKIAVLTGHSALVRSLEFSPDGKTLASASDDSSVKLWSFDAKAERTEGH